MSLAQLEEEKKQYQEQLDIVLTSLNDEPENAELLALKAELDEMIKMINESIGDIAPAKRTSTTNSTAATGKAPTPPPPAPEKWSRENHPAFRKQAQEEKDRAEAAAQQAAAEAAPVHYAVNDTVLAKWVSGDKGFYTARITAVTGSSTQPIYTVKFKSYDTVETLRAKDIKPVGSGGGNGGGIGGGVGSSSSSSGSKRKADGGAAASSSAGDATPTGTNPGASPFSSAGASATASNNGIVLQSAPSVYPQAEQQPADGEKPAKKFKKIKATKELEKGKSKWQEFTTKGKFGKAAKKDSMFRTPEGVHGRVGFTGSGQAMRKDPTRSRHIYQPNEDID